jgi:hypothetical protein
VIAPGGTKTIDQDFWRFGGGQGELFGWQFTYSDTKTDLCGLRISGSGVSVSLAAVTVTGTGVAIKNDAMDFKTAQMHFTTAMVNMAASGVFMLF